MDEKRELLGQMYLKNGLTPEVLAANQEYDLHMVEEQRQLCKK